MNKIIFLLIATFFCSKCVGQEEKIFLPDNINLTKLSEDEEFKNLQWNRYTTDNFTILSIDNENGKWLYNNIESIKNKCMNDWGISNYKLSTECRIMIVDKESLFKKFFNLTEPRIEFRKKDNKLEIIGVWLNWTKDKQEIENIISEVCFVDLMNKFSKNKEYISHGLPGTYKNVDEIKKIVKDTKPEIGFIDLAKEDFEKLNNLEKTSYRHNSIIFCLMLKKEFGTHKFLKLMLSGEENLKKILEIYGYTSKEELEKTYIRYCEDLKKEIEKNSINDKYLKVRK